MPVVITLDVELAARLRLQAQSRELSLEQYALQVLGNAAANGIDDDWQICNRRRISLIRQQFSSGLTHEEATELSHLQELMDRRLDEMDNQMLDDVNRLRLRVEQIVGPQPV